MRKLLRIIDQISTWAGRVVSVAVLVMVIIIAYDVILRYIFRAPTIWQYDVSYMLGGTIIMLGSGYVHLKRRHVRVDIFYNNFSPRLRLYLDIFFTLLFFFPFMTGILISAAEHAIHAYKIKEFSEVGFWRPIMWPFRLTITLGLAVLWFQGLANFVRDLYLLIKGEVL
ncbi:MAG: TRAP transporter small permease subunit [Thermodesulfobacteriota bacterium]